MADPQIVTTLRAKRDELERVVRAYEDKIKAAQYDLMHVNATLRLFELNGDHEVFPLHADVTRLFKRGEIWRLCKEALEAAPEPLDTRQLALAVIRAKGFDCSDPVLRKAVSYRIVQALTMQWKRQMLSSPGKRTGVRLWKIGLKENNAVEPLGGAVVG